MPTPVLQAACNLTFNLRKNIGRFFLQGYVPSVKIHCLDNNIVFKKNISTKQFLLINGVLMVFFN